MQGKNEIWGDYLGSGDHPRISVNGANLGALLNQLSTGLARVGGFQVKLVIGREAQSDVVARDEINSGKSGSGASR